MENIVSMDVQTIPRAVWFLGFYYCPGYSRGFSANNDGPLQPGGM